MKLGAIACMVLTSILATPAIAHADVDWARGLVTAEGVGVANRAAPSPAAARGPARRMAEDAARKKLAAQVVALPLAAGGKVDKQLARAAIDKLVAEAIAVAADLETDGSWRVTMAVPIEKVRQAIDGPRVLAAAAAAAAGAGDVDVPVVVVEGAAAVKPAVGWKVAGTAVATVFVKDAKEVQAWAKDAPRAKAGKAAKGELELVAPVAGVGAATLVVVVGAK